LRLKLARSLVGGSEETQQGTRLPPALKQVLRNALIGHLATEWQRTLPPNHHTVMAYTTTKPEYTLRVTIDFEDEAGYQWRRADISPPKRMGKELV
jgi:hypothetical protein